MDADGFTGVSVERTRRQIRNFYEEATDIAYDLNNVFIELFDELKPIWNSPKAVDFYNEHNGSIYFMLNDYSTGIVAIVRNAIRAFNNFASNNDIAPISDDFVGNIANNLTMDYQELTYINDSPMGMNLMQAKIVEDNFEKRIKNVLNNIDNLPMDIALYDDEGAQYAAYRGEIQKIKDFISSEVGSISAGIKAAMETESNEFRLAKEKNVNLFNG